VSTLTPDANSSTILTTPIVESDVNETSTTTSETRPAKSEYRDNRLCFAVEVDADWKTDGMPGGFASFAVGSGRAAFQITNVDLGSVPDLDGALAEVRRGAGGAYIQDIRADLRVDDQPARLVVFTSKFDYPFVALVIAPDCGDGRHALFISATGVDQAQFEAFLSRVHFRMVLSQP
jgi:hypothetical protein